MGIVIRQTIKSSFFVYLGIMIGVLNRLYLYPLYLSPEQIGFFQVLFTTGMVISQLGMLGTGSTFTRYFQYFKEKNLSAVFYFLFTLVTFIGGTLAVSILFIRKEFVMKFFAKDVSILDEYFQFIPLLVFLFIYNNVVTLFANNSLRLTVPSLFNDFGIKLITAIAVILFGFNLINFTAFLLIFTGAIMFANISILIYTVRLFKIRFSSHLHLISKAEYRNLLNYSLFIFLGGLSGSITNYADTLMLSSIEGFRATGIYSIAFFMGSVIEVPKRAVVAISTPILSKHWLNGNLVEIHKLYKQSSINQGIIGLFLLFMLWINLDEIFFFIPDSDVYSAGKWVALIIGLSKVTDMFMGVNTEILRTSGKYYYDLGVTLIFIFVSIGTNLILIPLYKLNGAALATLISVLFYNILRFIILKALYKISPFNAKSTVLLGLFLGLYILYYFVSVIVPHADTFSQSVLMIFVKTLFFGGLTLLSVFYLKISDEFNRMVISSLSKMKSIIGK
ncbi:MAG: lipopolysaccharide biosynthesis protein [Flavobacteriales bacterium]|nr:lipopolysaccharide biosynthesis protein [Flavobacteriales bacterium]